MAKTDFRTIEDYIDAAPEADREALRRLRDTIRQAVPEAEPVISYQIPAFRHHGWVFYFSAHANHYSISQPPPFAAFDAFAEELKGYKRSKSAVQFPKDGVPFELIGRMAAFQAQENVRRAEAKVAGRKKKA